MDSRGNYYDRPPSRGRGPPPPSWEPYDDHYDNYGRPPPSHHRGPPNHYDDYSGPPRYPDERPPPPRHPDDRPPSRFYEDDLPYDDFSRKGVRPGLVPLKSNPRGRGRGQNGGGRGRGSCNSFNGPNQTPRDDKTKNNATNKQGTSQASKPAWLSQPTATPAAVTTSSNPPTPSKPAWLSQPTTTTAVNINSSSSSTHSKPATSTLSSKPAWLTQSTTSTTGPSSSSSKPAWLTQAVASTNTSNPSTSKPTWLTKTTVSTSNSNTTSSKPAWLSQSVNKAVTTTSNSLPKKPTWMTQGTPSTNNAKPSPKPAWLSKPSTPVQPTTAKQVPSKSNESSLPPPPPPPPAYPPPPNQPKIHPTQEHTPFTIPPTPQINQGKPKKAKPKVQQGEVKVSGPSDTTFISFKNSLQEYCQKTGLAVPTYKSFKSSYGYSATVELSNGKKFHTQSIQKDKKEAEQFAALETLKNLGLLPLNTNFVNPPKPQLGAKRAKPTPAAVAKKLKLGTNAPPSNSPNYKCQLNEFCQKFHLPTPTYETAHNGTGFVTTLVYNKKVYLSTAPQATKKDAEQNVAQLALSKVNQAPPPSEPRQGPVLYPNFVVASNNPEVSTNTFIAAAATTSQENKPEQQNTTVIPVRSVQDLTSKNITPIISYKNKLQEVCQKQKINLPTYESTRDDKFYSCKVTIQGQVFTATGCTTKKGSEQSAARVALQALGLLKE